jgi:hypothetical protein
MYEGIDQHPGITLVHHSEKIIESFRGIFASYTASNQEYKKWDQALSYYLKIDEAPYIQRLTQLIEAVDVHR